MAASETLLFSMENDLLVEGFPSLGFKVASNLAKELSEKLREMNQIVQDLTRKNAALKK